MPSAGQPPPFGHSRDYWDVLKTPLNLKVTVGYVLEKLGKETAFAVVMLRTTMLFLRDRTKAFLKGPLVGEWAAGLPKAISDCCPVGEVEIDLDGITCADRAGERALQVLWEAHRRFVAHSVFGHALCLGLGIPVEECDPGASVPASQKSGVRP